MSLQLGTEAHPWIEDLCGRMSHLLGWPLKYQSVGTETAALIERRRQVDPERLWSAEIHNGQSRTGWLYTDLPENRAADPLYRTVCGVGDVLAELLSSVASTSCSLESRTQEMTTLAEMNRPLPCNGDPFAPLERLLTGVTQLTSFRGAAFFLLNPTAKSLSLRAQHGAEQLPTPAPERNLVDGPPDLDALAHGHILLHRHPEDPRGDWFPAAASTAVCMSVRSDAGPLGTLWAYDRRHRTPQDREFHVLESIAAQLSTALERVVLLRESAVQQRLRRDMLMASECQPRDLVDALRSSVGVDAAAVCASRFEIGGDLCELVPLSPTRTAIAVGDATGDSVPAAMVCSAIRGALRTLIDGAAPGDTVEVMSCLNRTLYQITPTHLFMSLLYGVLDTSKRTFTYTNAGHPTPLWIQRDRTSTLESHGLLLGVCDDAEYQHSTLQLAAGDTLVMFSDGITEAMNRGRRMFRSDGITEAIAECTDGTAHDLLQAISARLQSHTAGGGDPDDRTLLVLKIT